MNLKWKMINRDYYTSEFKEYSIFIEKSILWFIEKDRKTIDCCYYHPNIAKNELEAKVQAERALDKIINN